MIPRVPLPSLIAGLNGPAMTALLNASTVPTSPATSMSSLLASSSMVEASAFVTSRMRYSSRSSATTFWSKIWKAARPGCSMMVRPYLT